MKKNKNNIKLLVSVSILMLVLIIGTTYAWYRITRSSDTINKIKAGSLEMTLDDTATEGIKLLNEVPRSYLQGMKTKEYTFTLTNTGTTTNDYTIYLDDVLKFTDDQGKEITITDDTKLEDTKIRYILLKDGESAASTKSKLLSAATERIIDTGKIDKNQTIKYSLRMWIDSRAENEVMGKMFNAKLRVEASQSQQDGNLTATKLCKKATTLHTETCDDGKCKELWSGVKQSYNTGDTITYGKIGNDLSLGSAYTCDVNGDGVYDEETERFYYLTDLNSNTAVLVYYTNVEAGKPTNTGKFAYDESNSNSNGPVTAIKQLPTVSQWKNTKLCNSIRNITDENGKIVKADFDYSLYAARLLSYQEVYNSCYKASVCNTMRYDSCLSTDCEFLMENSNYVKKSSSLVSDIMLESSYSVNDYSVTYIDGSFSMINYQAVFNYFGVRPAIEVSKDKIEGYDSLLQGKTCEVEENMIQNNGPGKGYSLLYSDRVSYDSTTNTYTLVSPQPFIVGTDTTTLLNKYTMFGTSTSAQQTFYITELGSDGGISKYYVATGGKCAN